jgi:dTDP-4-amino-4,6-dideoxygalactose transaminase
MQIPFNKPFLTGKEIGYIRKAIRHGKISGNGYFTSLCHNYFRTRYGFNEVLLTTSCTHALEMAAILINIEPGDEVIMPSFTFVSTANAFVLRGARVIFADSTPDLPNLDTSGLEKLITPRTRAIIPVHYAGCAYNLDVIMDIANKHKLYVIEDAAQAIDSRYHDKPLGGFGHLSAFSFHETKNISSGEGGLLVINDQKFKKRAEIIWEKGTNRAEYFRGEVNKYGWVDIGSSWLPSEITAAFLYAQLNQMDVIQKKRIKNWNLYHSLLKELENTNKIRLPLIPPGSTNNAHMFYIILDSAITRDKLISWLKSKGIMAVFHYQSLHESEFYRTQHDGRVLSWSNFYSDCLLRLPMYYELSESDIIRICAAIREFFK